jgi:hypothetical protein
MASILLFYVLQKCRAYLFSFSLNTVAVASAFSHMTPAFPGKFKIRFSLSVLLSLILHYPRRADLVSAEIFLDTYGARP